MANKEVVKNIEALDLELKQVARGHSILNENQVQKLFNSTPRRWTYMRPGKGGDQWRYVKRGYVRRTLDSVFGFDWDFQPETSVQEAFEVAKLTGSVIVKGTITARVLDARGQLIATLQKGDYGRADVKWKMVGSGDNRKRKLDDFTGFPVPLDFGNDLKAANTDCFKRCAMWFGIAADVYDPEEFMQINIIGADGNTEKDKNVSDMKKKALKQLKNESKETKNAG